MASELGPDDRALLDQVARRVVELRLEVPAVLTLETCRPLSVVAGQALAFFQPFTQALLPWAGHARFATLIERRETVEHLARLIEERAEEARRARAARRAGGRRAR